MAERQMSEAYIAMIKLDRGTHDTATITDQHRRIKLIQKGEFNIPNTNLSVEGQLDLPVSPFLQQATIYKQ